mmetsp:Transcript_14248/g.44854  ORF Transcript_14248/g.44854 Transcript_14248/m.44854 type:complete len:259 (+) Transcript_14248:2995-3771(+)
MNVARAVAGRGVLLSASGLAEWERVVPEAAMKTGMQRAPSMRAAAKASRAPVAWSANRVVSQWWVTSLSTDGSKDGRASPFSEVEPTKAARAWASVRDESSLTEAEEEVRAGPACSRGDTRADAAIARIASAMRCTSAALVVDLGAVALSVAQTCSTSWRCSRSRTSVANSSRLKDLPRDRLFFTNMIQSRNGNCTPRRARVPGRRDRGRSGVRLVVLCARARGGKPDCPCRSCLLRSFSLTAGGNDRTKISEISEKE